MTFAMACLSFLLCSGIPVVDGFHCTTSSNDNRGLNAPRSSNMFSSSSSSLTMGLYDSPLPPRPSPQNGPTSNSNNNDDDAYIDTPPPAAARLFSMSSDGSEVNGLLPPLKGRGSNGVYDSPKYGEQDPKVLNIVRGLSVAWEDAAWVLEAYQGDLDEAWIAISTQKRKNLDDSVALPAASGIDWDNEFARLSKKDTQGTNIQTPGGGNAGGKRNLAQEQFKQGVNDFFTKSELTGARDWLPTKNPEPDEDEP